MSTKSKWTTLVASAFGGGTLFHFGCLGGFGEGSLGDFWDGFFNTGWPAGNRWANILLDVLNEELFG